MPEADDRIRAALQELGGHVPVDDAAEVSRRAMDGGGPAGEAPPQRWFVAAAAALVLVALAVGALALTSGSDDRDAVQVTEEPPPVEDGPELLWTREAITSSGSFAPSGGQLVVVDEERVFVATGHGAGSGSDWQVTALDRDAGETEWERSAPDPMFLGGGAGDELLVMQPTLLQGMDATSGEDRWHVDLTELGLEGYEPTVADASVEPTVVGLSAVGEGDTRPPILLAIGRAGEVLWQSSLADGTDLQWGPPARHEDTVILLSTPSHPDSAAGNIAHAIDSTDGSVLWTIDLGGITGFVEQGAVHDGEHAYLPGPDALVAVGLDQGEVRWERAAIYPRLHSEPGSALWAAVADREVVSFDPATGEEIRSHEILEDDSTRTGVSHLVGLGDGGLLVTTPDRGAAIDTATGEALWQLEWPGSLMEAPQLSGDLLVVATQAEDHTVPGDVTAYRIPGAPAPVPGTTTPPETTEPESVDIDAVVAVDPAEIERDLLLFGEDGIAWFEGGEHRQVWSEPVDQAFPDGTGGVVFQDRDFGAIRWLPADASAPADLVTPGDQETVALHGVLEGDAGRAVLYTHRLVTVREDEQERLYSHDLATGAETDLGRTGGIESGLDAVAVADAGLLVSTCHLQCSIHWLASEASAERDEVLPATWISGLDVAGAAMAYVRYPDPHLAGEPGQPTQPFLVLAETEGETRAEIPLPHVVSGWTFVDLADDGRSALLWSRSHDERPTRAVYVDGLGTAEPRARVLEGVEAARFP